MTSELRAVMGIVVGALAAVTLAACSGAGDLSITNDGPDSVTVEIGEDEVAVEAYGGVVLLDYGCTPGDVTVTFATGTTIVLSGPVCPEQEIVIVDETAALRSAPTDGIGGAGHRG